MAHGLLIHTSMDHSSPPRRTALVVDDDQPTLELLHEVLEGAGFATTAVDRGIAALTMLAKQRFDVLVVDVNLPDMSGMAVCDLARERYHEEMVILVMTGVNIEHRRVGSIHLCADDFLGKPFDPWDLIALIERTMGQAP
jgi:DNA-binding response OmpR family regulator